MVWLLKQFLRKHANMAFKTISLDIMTEWLKNLYPDTQVVIDSEETFTEMSAQIDPYQKRVQTISTTTLQKLWYQVVPTHYGVLSLLVWWCYNGWEGLRLEIIYKVVLN